MQVTSFMENEVAESPKIIKRQLQNSVTILKEISKRLQLNPPSFVATIARGSSDHAALFAKYAIESQLGIVTTTIAPSIHTIYKTKINYKNSLVIGISQSGKSPDLVESMAYAKKSGALTVALINENNSPLEKECEYCIPLLAQKERSIAATKSFIASITRIIQFIAYWNCDNKLKEDLIALPDILANQTLNYNKSNLNHLYTASHILVVGRGFTFPLALESALKLKETCGLHAEAFSSAEILHGPIELIKENFPTLIYVNNDATFTSIAKLIELLIQKKSIITIIGSKKIIQDFKLPKNKNIIKIATNNSNKLGPICNSVPLIYCFYPLVAQLAKLKGKNPDKPTNLNKTTITV
ncbi:SIS domain-containing protein [Spirobacillus cienkowskii]|uniref:SIS domain-containing protein n=1 Tax=Spirobacillus cienkowskii TaxID=495820 RepID=UPI0030D3781B